MLAGIIIFSSFYFSCWILVYMVTIWQYDNVPYYKSTMCFLKKASLVGFFIQLFINWCFKSGSLCRNLF